MRATLTASAPGRICLFGEHQDYLGLPVIAAAIDLRVTVEGRPRGDAQFHLSLPDVGGKDVLDNAGGALPYRHGRDYLRAAVNVLRRDGVCWPSGYDVVVRGDIPINSGASSSSALQVAWVAFLLAAAGDARSAVPVEIARLAHASEVTEFGAPGGMMDHFTCALGGVIRLDCRPPYRAEALPAWPGEFVLVDSGIPKDTNGVLGARRRALEALPLDYAALADSAATAACEVGRISDPAARALAEATIGNRRLTDQARGLLLGPPDQAVLGLLLTEHHRLLSAGLDVSLPEIDAHLAAGLAAGAAGGKINGSGCGGSFFVLCHGCGQQMQQFYQSRNLRADIVRISHGVEVQQ